MSRDVAVVDPGDAVMLSEAVLSVAVAHSRMAAASGSALSSGAAGLKSI